MQTFAFGKYKDRHISDPEVDTQYLLWLRERYTKDIADIDAEVARREQAAFGNLSWVERIVQVGFRNLAQQHHSDHGGDDNDMREILAAKAELTRILEVQRARNRR